MKENRLIIKIDKPIGEVFEFSTNPDNTHRWVDSIVKEETNEWPVKVGTIYRNQNKEGMSSEYTVTDFEKDKIFVLKQTHGDYHVRYTYTTLDENSTQLEYYEWVENGELSEPFSIHGLEKLKNILEIKQ